MLALTSTPARVPELRALGVLSARGALTIGRTDQEAEVERLLQLPGVLAGEQHPRDVGLDQLDATLRAGQHAGPAQPLSLVAVDLDNFSALNQRFGHAEGDAVLQAISQQLLLNLRCQDLLCRLAGDRFVVLLPNTGETLARQLAGELQQAVAHLAHKTRQHGERLHLSATVAVVMAVDEDPQTLLQRLNLALARAKQPLALSA